MTPETSNTNGASRVATALLCVVVVGAVAAAPVAAHTGDHTSVEMNQPGLVVEVQPNGDADVTVVVTYDLSESSDRDAFEQVSGDNTSKQRLGDEYESRLQTVAQQASNDTGREMSVSDSTVKTRLVDNESTGVVEMTVMWENLASVDGDRLTLAEPFNDEFTLEDRFVVVVPETYELESTNSEPSEQSDSVLIWENPSFDEFELVMSVADSGESTGDSDDGGSDTETPGQPGFGALAGLVAVFATALIARHQQNR